MQFTEHDITDISLSFSFFVWNTKHYEINKQKCSILFWTPLSFWKLVASPIYWLTTASIQIISLERLLELLLLNGEEASGAFLRLPDDSHPPAFLRPRSLTCHRIQHFSDVSSSFSCKARGRIKWDQGTMERDKSWTNWGFGWNCYLHLVYQMLTCSFKESSLTSLTKVLRNVIH